MNPEAQTALAKWREENQGLEIVRLTPIEKLYQTPNSKSQAIKAKCYECMGADSSAMSEVRKCTSYQCPLFAFRPGAINVGYY